MKILIDGDACSKKDTVIKLAKKYNIPVHIYCDINHNIDDDYADVFIVDCESNSADFAIANHIEADDIVVTNDIGLATMAMAMRGRPINNYGTIYTSRNIGKYINHKYMIKASIRKQRNTNHHSNLPKNPKPKQSFYASLLYLIRKTRKKDMQYQAS